MTLQGQRKNEYLNKAPKIRLAADIVLYETGNIITILGWPEFWGGVTGNVIKMLETEFKKSFTLEKAAEISEETYIHTREFLNKTSLLFVRHREYTNVEILKADKEFQKMFTELQEIYDSIQQAINNETSQYKKIKGK
uniref:Uncharacterized protein n=2 Tax=Cohnella candidum TaxID=2674991 RepID=A0A3G3JYI8_9BACL|nr:hypothetical protein EAV92_12440 [Cohnella candidum]